MLTPNTLHSAIPYISINFHFESAAFAYEDVVRLIPGMMSSIHHCRSYPQSISLMGECLVNQEEVCPIASTRLPGFVSMHGWSIWGVGDEMYMKVCCKILDAKIKKDIISSKSKAFLWFRIPNLTTQDMCLILQNVVLVRAQVHQR